MPRLAKALLELASQRMPGPAYQRAVKLFTGEHQTLTQRFGCFGCVFMLATSGFKAVKDWVYGMRLHNWFTLQKLTG